MLQLKGLGIIVDAAAYGTISPTLAIWIGAGVVTAYVMVSGVRGSAWTAVVKDTLILAVVLFLGIYLPIHYYGGYGAMFSAIQAARPDFAGVAGERRERRLVRFHRPAHRARFLHVAALVRFAVHGEGRAHLPPQRRLLPLYQLILLFVFFVGFAAILKVPGLKGPEIDLSLLRLSVQTFDPWFVGVIGAAGVLTALVPGSMILITAATLLANNMFRIFRPQTTDATVSRLAKLLVPVVALVSVFFTLRGGATIVALLLMGYSFVTQLFPTADRQPAATQPGHARKAPSPASALVSRPSPPSR